MAIHWDRTDIAFEPDMEEPGFFVAYLYDIETEDILDSMGGIDGGNGEYIWISDHGNVHPSDETVDFVKVMFESIEFD